MLRLLLSAILRSAARLVPAPERAEWLAEWSAELWYVERGATAFCLGSIHDALCLRGKSLSARRALRVDSPLRCLFLLATAAALGFALASLPSRNLFVFPFSLAGLAQVARGCPWLYLLSFLVLLTLNPLALGQSVPHRPFATRSRCWLFFALKSGLLVPTIWFAGLALAPMFPVALWIVFFGWILGFRWALTDQQQRCPVCLHQLSSTIEVGRPGHMLLDPCATELMCPLGHGTVCIPGISTTWRPMRTWE